MAFLMMFGFLIFYAIIFVFIYANIKPNSLSYNHLDAVLMKCQLYVLQNRSQVYNVLLITKTGFA